MSDVLDILDIERPQTPEISKESILDGRKVCILTHTSQSRNKGLVNF